ncbi:MAG: flagellar motor switch protein FliN [Bacteriovoracia bacterium]
MADQAAEKMDDAAAAMAAALGGGEAAPAADTPPADAAAGGTPGAPGGPAQGGGEAKAADRGSIQTLDFILDIPLKVTVELGRTKMMIRDILQLAQGSVVELTKFAGEPLEVLVNEKLVARGEVVVVNEKFGIRLTDIISPVERIEQLK